MHLAGVQRDRSSSLSHFPLESLSNAAKQYLHQQGTEFWKTFPGSEETKQPETLISLGKFKKLLMLSLCKTCVSPSDIRDLQFEEWISVKREEQRFGKKCYLEQNSPIVISVEHFMVSYISAATGALFCKYVKILFTKLGQHLQPDSFKKHQAYFFFWDLQLSSCLEGGFRWGPVFSVPEKRLFSLLAMGSGSPLRAVLPFPTPVSWGFLRTDFWRGLPLAQAGSGGVADNRNSSSCCLVF